MDQIGNFSLKLEKQLEAIQRTVPPSSGQYQNQWWETLCFDLSLNSLEGNMSLQAPTKFYGCVFPDFNSVPIRKM
ncbi:MAG: hypothetical protein IPN79_10775 [Saprospiraceae bacterium]|nr:hypothetical protein [Saprospiraceae bacterium]